MPMHPNEELDHQEFQDGPVLILPPFLVFDYLPQHLIPFYWVCFSPPKNNGNDFQVQYRLCQPCNMAVIY